MRTRMLGRLRFNISRALHRRCGSCGTRAVSSCAWARRETIRVMGYDPQVNYSCGYCGMPTNFFGKPLRRS